MLDLEFEISDKVFVSVASYKHIMRSNKKGKLASRFRGPFKALEHVSKVAY